MNELKPGGFVVVFGNGLFKGRDLQQVLPEKKIVTIKQTNKAAGFLYRLINKRQKVGIVMSLSTSSTYIVPSTAPTLFDPESFVEYYKQNYARPRPLPSRNSKQDWPHFSSQNQKALKTLFSTLSFAETAEGTMGTRLLNIAKTELDRQSLDLYVQEEVRHGQEFVWLASELGVGFDPNAPDAQGKQATTVANLLNFGRLVDAANLILVAEVIILPIYRTLAQELGHPLIKDVFANIMRDEAGHIRYHGKRVQAELAQTGFLGKFVLKAGHCFGLLMMLVSINWILWPPIKTLTGMSWHDLLNRVESSYNKYYTKDKEMALLKSSAMFKLVRLLPLK